MIGPDDFVEHILRPEQLVQDQPAVRVSVPVEMQVERSIGREQLVHEHQPLVKEREVRVYILPEVVVAFCQRPLPRPARILSAAHPGWIFAVCEEWRIGIYKGDAPLIFSEERAHDLCIIPQD